MGYRMGQNIGINAANKIKKKMNLDLTVVTSKTPINDVKFLSL